MIQTPIDVFLEPPTGPTLVGCSPLQAFWAIALLGIGRIAARSVRASVVVQGG